MMRERQRWQPEEDALLREYVKQYGAKEWALVSERMGRPLHRDPKSCHERWRNYLRPGLKKGSLSPDEQSLLISLQARYGNKWKSIAAHLPGRTPKRLGKWWEVFKEKQLKLNTNHTSSSSSFSSSSSPFAFPPSVSAAGAASPSAYEHILHTFAEKHALNMTCTDPSPSPGSSSSAAAAPSVALSLSISPPPVPELAPHQLPLVARLCEEVEEGRRAWAQHRKDAAWRLSRLEQQMETEKARRKREKIEEVEERIQRLREEEKAWLEKADAEWRERMGHLRTEAEAVEMEKAEAWARKQAKLLSLIQTIAGGEGRWSSRDDSILQLPN